MIRPKVNSTVGLASLGAVLLWAALPPVDFGPLAWVAPIPWLLLIRRNELEGRRPYRTLWMVGFSFWLAALHWLRLPYWATGIGWIALSFYLAFYLPLFVAIGRTAVHRLHVPSIVAAPVIWTGFELARAHLLTGFTMASLGHTQYRWIDLIQISDLVGFYGVCFLVMFVAACLAAMIPVDGRRWATKDLCLLAPIALALAAALTYGHFRRQVAPREPAAEILLVQGSIDIEIKDDPTKLDAIHDQYDELTRQGVEACRDAHGRAPDLVVWPETMFRHSLLFYDRDAQPPPGWPYSRDDFFRWLAWQNRQTQLELAKLLGMADSPLLLGIDAEEYTSGRPRYYNSAAYFGRDGRLLGRYDKMHPVMYGEYLPFGYWMPWLQDHWPVRILTEGERPVSMPVGRLRIAPNICYETVLPHLIRRQVNDLIAAGEEPDVLVNLTNDGWFWGSSELDMHLICGVFRAIEVRKPVVIAANTGFSAWIDGDGTILARGPRQDTGTLLCSVAPDSRSSWYLRYGDWFPGACLLATLLAAGYGLWRSRRERVCAATSAVKRA